MCKRLLDISNIIAGPCASYNSWTMHCTVYCHIWSPLLPIVAAWTIHYTVYCHIWSPVLPIIAGPSMHCTVYCHNRSPLLPYIPGPSIVLFAATFGPPRYLGPSTPLHDQKCHFSVLMKEVALTELFRGSSC